MKAPWQAGMVIKVKNPFHAGCLRPNATGGKGGVGKAVCCKLSDSPPPGFALSLAIHACRSGQHLRGVIKHEWPRPLPPFQGGGGAVPFAMLQKLQKLVVFYGFCFYLHVYSTFEAYVSWKILFAFPIC
jgi:hypothetical protein